MIRTVLAGLRPTTVPGFRWSSRATAGALALVAAAGTLSVLATVSGLVDLLGTGDDTVLLVTVGGLVGLSTSLGFTRIRPAERIRDADVLGGVTLCLLLMVAMVAALHLLIGTTGSVVDALADSTAGLTTTALGVLSPDMTDHAGRFLRAGSQWVGGFGGLMVAVAVLPFFGAEREFADRSRQRGRRPMAPNRQTAVRNLVYLHGVVSLGTWIGFTLAGLGTFDALLVAMATVSTGGMVDGDPFAAPAVQYVAIVGMAVTGTSLVVLWRLVVGRSRGLLRSTELGAYLGLLVTGTALFLLWTGGSGVEGLRRAAFTVTAAVTTTGFSSAPSGTWAAAAPVLLLGLVSIGPMTGSAGGGFQIMRHRALIQIALREMVRQLHPRVVSRVRLGGRVVSEPTLSRIVVVQFLVVSVVFATATVVAAMGLDLATALGVAVHAVSTGGPVRALDGSLLDPTDWSASVRLAILPAMVIGRLSIYPAMVAASGTISAVRHRVRLRRRIRSYRGRTV
jgi:trk system potassium uptake protein TrkH